MAEADAVRERMVGGLTSFAVAAAWGQLAFFGFIGFVVFGLSRIAAIEPAALAGSVLRPAVPARAARRPARLGVDRWPGPGRRSPGSTR